MKVKNIILTTALCIAAAVSCSRLMSSSKPEPENVIAKETHHTYRQVKEEKPIDLYARVRKPLAPLYTSEHEEIRAKPTSFKDAATCIAEKESAVYVWGSLEAAQFALRQHESESPYLWMDCPSESELLDAIALRLWKYPNDQAAQEGLVMLVTRRLDTRLCQNILDEAEITGAFPQETIDEYADCNTIYEERKIAWALDPQSPMGFLLEFAINHAEGRALLGKIILGLDCEYCYINFENGTSAFDDAVRYFATTPPNRRTDVQRAVLEDAFRENAARLGSLAANADEMDIMPKLMSGHYESVADIIASASGCMQPPAEPVNNTPMATTLTAAENAMVQRRCNPE